MNLIQCDLACKHQKDGYCQLDKPLLVTNSTAGGCMHFVGNKKLVSPH